MIRPNLAAFLQGAAVIPPCIGTGVAEIDAALPWGGLPRGLHEIASPAGDAAGIGFAATLMRQRSGPVLWCRLRGAAGMPYGAGLAALGLDPGRLILVEAVKSADLLWAMEEGLRTRRLAAVLGEGAKLDMTASRRLQLAAEAGESVALVVPPPAGPGALAASLAAVTRWLVTSVASVAEAGGPGRPRWSVELWRCRGGGRLQSWVVEWNDAALSLDLVSPVAGRTLAAAAG